MAGDLSSLLRERLTDEKIRACHGAWVSCFWPAANLGEPDAVCAMRNAIMSALVPALEQIQREQESKREAAEQREAALRAALETVLKSAHPHPTEHRAMTAAWAIGRNALTVKESD